MENSKNRQIDNSDEEISIKEIILKIQEFFWEVIRHWKLITLITIPFVAFMLYKAFTAHAKFPAHLTFMLNEDKGGGLGAVGGLLGSFGLGGGSGDYNLSKMMELSKTRTIIQSSLFDSTEVGGLDDYYANHLIRIYEYHERWEDDTTGMKNLLFTHNDFSRFKRPENKALKILHRKIIGDAENKVKGILKSNPGDDTGIMKLTVNSRNESFSVAFVQTVYKQLSEFYINKTIEKQEKTHYVVKEKVDSIQRTLQASEYALASFKDSSLGLISKKAKLKELQLEAKIRMLYGMLGEAMKNLEISDFSLKNKTPFIQIVDKPIAPIKPSAESKIMAIILGGFIGGFLGAAFVVIRKIYRDIMAST